MVKVEMKLRGIGLDKKNKNIFDVCRCFTA
jgi:hypothetical protein